MTDGPIDHPEPARAGIPWGRIAVVTIIVSLLVMWLWIYLYAPRDNPDRFSSSAYAEAAEPICAAAQARIDALPPGRFADTPQDRAVGVREGTEITEQLVADLKDLRTLVTDPDDLRILDAWFEDWEEGYLVDGGPMSSDSNRPRSTPTTATLRSSFRSASRRVLHPADRRARERQRHAVVRRARRYLSQAFALATLRPATARR